MADSEIEEIFKFNKRWFCFSCGLKIQLELESEGDVPEEIWDQETFSDTEFPHLLKNGESDTPKSCAACGIFLYNPLTELGLTAVKNAVKLGSEDEGFQRRLQEWGSFYFEE